MRGFLTIQAALLLPFFVHAQVSYPDSLRNELETATADSTRFRLNDRLSNYYAEKKLDSAIFYGEQALANARKNKKQFDIASTLVLNALVLNYDGKYGEALQYILEALPIAEDPDSEKSQWRFDDSTDARTRRLNLLAFAHHTYALLEANIGNMDEELFHYKEEIRIARANNDSFRIQLAYMNLGNTYQRLGKPDSALYFGMKADAMAESSDRLYYNGWNLANIGDVYFKRKEYSLAKQYYYKALRLSESNENAGSLRWAVVRLFRLYQEEGNQDSSLYFAKRSLASTISDDVGYLTGAYENLYRAFAMKGPPDSANKYLKLAFDTRDSAYDQEIKNLTDFQHLTMNEQLRLRELEKEKVEYQGKVRTYSLLAGVVILLIIGLLLYRNNRQKRRSNRRLEDALNHLKTTQTQLIQSEKMASLGELTAGIAHEIQNPLNFVNNFSELNEELAGELKEELATGNGQLATNLADEIKENSKKITYHGKRADAIVKGMLQHSRTSSGQKEPVDLNALVEEYTRLAYHGIRARDKSFKGEYTTELDPAVDTVNLVPQDIGRVVLNLVNNAFHAASAEALAKVHSDFRPMVRVSTRKVEDKVEVAVEDNGAGIPDNISEKIFQPFFTTKPTGQGTGLGLSLSYDIVKAHGGELRCGSSNGGGAVFTVLLPSNSHV